METLTITVHVAGFPRVFNRPRLRAAYLLRLDHPTGARAVLGALIDDFGIGRQEALRLTLGDAACVTNNIEPEETDMSETQADIVPEIKPGMWVWFSSADEEGFREAKTVEPWTAKPYSFNWDLAREWVQITYTDGHVEDRPRYSTHEIWKSGPRPEARA